jgi:hypothetical protein
MRLENDTLLILAILYASGKMLNTNITLTLFILTVLQNEITYAHEIYMCMH